MGIRGIGAGIAALAAGMMRAQFVDVPRRSRKQRAGNNWPHQGERECLRRWKQITFASAVGPYDGALSRRKRRDLKQIPSGASLG